MASHLAGAETAEVDFAEHVQTYRLFTNGMKYGAVAVIAILILLAITTL
ncbi:aa3-type cytochrome c oxidase subunit IV [uncultured Methylovirgula sp.]|nr:aa3-type cytochrome c oxidase subunit IV [uncultured Methylovirgula sp.]